jgi:hypothetical protein
MKTKQAMEETLSSEKIIQLGTKYFFKEELDLKYLKKREAFMKLLTEKLVPYITEEHFNPVSCFISYAWAEENHPHYAKQKYYEHWVAQLAGILQKTNIKIYLDGWEDRTTSRTNKFSVQLVNNSVYVLVIGTKLYLEKYNRDSTDIIKSYPAAEFEATLIERMIGNNEIKRGRVFPVLLEDCEPECFPSLIWANGNIPSVFFQQDYFKSLFKLLRDLYQIDPQNDVFQGIIEEFELSASAIDEQISDVMQTEYLQKVTQEILSNQAKLTKEHEEAVTKPSKSPNHLGHLTSNSTTISSTIPHHAPQILRGALPNAVEAITFEEHEVARDGSCGFHTLGVSRKEVVDLLLPYATNQEIRKELAPEIINALGGNDIGSAATETSRILYKRYAECLALIPLLEQEANNLIRKTELNAPLRGLVNLVFYFKQQNNKEYAEMLNRLEMQLKNDRNCEQEMHQYTCSQAAYTAYVHSLGKMAWLGYKSAKLIARLKSINLYIWTLSTKELGWLELRDYNISPNNSNIIHMLHTSGFTHFNLLTESSLELTEHLKHENVKGLNGLYSSFSNNKPNLSAASSNSNANFFNAAINISPISTFKNPLSKMLSEKEKQELAKENLEMHSHNKKK